MSELVDNVRRLMLSTQRVKPMFVLIWTHASGAAISKFETKDGVVFLMHPDTLSHVLRDAAGHEVKLDDPAFLLGVPIVNHRDTGPDAERARKIMQDALGSFAAGVF